MSLSRPPLKFGPFPAGMIVDEIVIALRAWSAAAKIDGKKKTAVLWPAGAIDR
jgi:hypothetical protein